MKLEFCCDASIKKYNNGRTFGCAGVICLNNDYQSYNIIPDTTNNRAELMAIYDSIIMAHKMIIDNNLTEDLDITIYSDSKNGVFGLREWMKNWIKKRDNNGILYRYDNKPVENQELYLMIISYLKTNNIYIKLRHQKGHINYNKENHLQKAFDVFKQSNGYELDMSYIAKISYYNSMADNNSRLCLFNINPDLYPIIDNTNNKIMVRYVIDENDLKIYLIDNLEGKMINTNSPIIQNMIINGQFGVSSPQYNQYGQQNINMGYGCGYNNYQQPYQQQFGYFNQQLNDYNNPYNNEYFNQQQSYSYGNDYFNQQPKYDYYNPYGNMFNNNNCNNYGYGGNMIYSPMAIQKQRQEQIELAKIKMRISSAYFGKEMSDEEMNKVLFPERQQQTRISDKERIENAEYMMCKSIVETSYNPNREPTNAERTAWTLCEMSRRMHEELDSHGLCQFLEEDLWKLQREEWIRNNINLNAGRNLGSTYSSKDYSELLQMHNSSHSGFINQLLDTSKYDNNTPDMELGMNIAFDAERKRRNILEGKVPEFISSDEVQERRHKFTNAIMQQIYNKGGGV